MNETTNDLETKLEFEIWLKELFANDYRARNKIYNTEGVLFSYAGKEAKGLSQTVKSRDIDAATYAQKEFDELKPWNKETYFQEFLRIHGNE